jgi:hypothetical protein
MIDLLLNRRAVIEAGTTPMPMPINGTRVYQADHANNSQTAGAVPPAVMIRVPSAQYRIILKTTIVADNTDHKLNTDAFGTVPMTNTTSI